MYGDDRRNAVQGSQPTETPQMLRMDNIRLKRLHCSPEHGGEHCEILGQFSGAEICEGRRALGMGRKAGKIER